MSDTIISRMEYGASGFKFRSEFHKRINIAMDATTSEAPNAYILIENIPSNISANSKTITLMVSMRFHRYLIMINSNIGDIMGDPNQNLLTVWEMGKNEGYCQINDAKFKFSSTSQAGMMAVWLKVYMDESQSMFEIEDISNNIDVEYSATLMGNDDTEYNGTTIGAWFSSAQAGLTQGKVFHLQNKELDTALNIGGSSKKTVQEALGGLNSAKLDIEDACENSTFSTTKQYYIGDFVIRNNDVYECIVAHYGSWNSSHFTKRYLAQEIQASPRYNMMGGSAYRLLKPASANSKNGWYEISLQTNLVALSASSWTDATVTMSNGIFDFFDPSELQFLHIAVTQQTAVLINNDTVENYPVFCRIKPEMHEANKFSLSLKAIDSTTEGNRYVRVTFIAYIHQTD